VNRLRGPISRNVTGSIALAAAVALSVAGCSGDDKPTPKTSPGVTSSPSSPGTAPAAMKDESAAVLGWTPPLPVAQTSGKLAQGVTSENVATVPATAEIISVRASDASTILTWQLSSPADLDPQGWTLSTHSSRFWPDTVRLMDPVGKKSYAVNTMTLPGSTYGVSSEYPLHVGPDPVRMTSEYPALPATATSVSVRIPNFAPVTVPVTR
jgi:hypothetical protein